jgi:hypothetical protein
MCRSTISTQRDWTVTVRAVSHDARPSHSHENVDQKRSTAQHTLYTTQNLDNRYVTRPGFGRALPKRGATPDESQILTLPQCVAQQPRNTCEHTGCRSPPPSTVGCTLSRELPDVAALFSPRRTWTPSRRFLLRGSVKRTATTCDSTQGRQDATPRRCETKHAAARGNPEGRETTTAGSKELLHESNPPLSPSLEFTTTPTCKHVLPRSTPLPPFIPAGLSSTHF